MDLHPNQFGVSLGHEPANPKPLQNGGQPSQGTLFRQPKPTAEHRYAAKGYTPERRNAIAEAIPKGSVGVSSTWSDPGGGKGPVFPTIEQAGSAKEQRAWTRRSLVDIYSRSTVPVENVQRNTPLIKVAPFGAGAGRMEVTFDTAGGEVTPTQGTMRLHPGGGPLRSRAEVEHVAIHELGHHTEFETDPGEFVRRHHAEKAMYGKTQPSAEGYAEGYAFKHRVPRRNEPSASFRDVMDVTRLHDKPPFRRAFERTSGTPLSTALGQHEHLGPQFEQRSLFHGPSSEGQRYVKTWSVPAHVGSIKVGA